MKTLPKIKRKKNKKNGRYEGNCYAFIAGRKVDLGTEDHNVAIKNLRAAVKGKREFQSDTTAAAAATVEVLQLVDPPAPAPAPPQNGKQTSHGGGELETPKGTMLPIEPAAPLQLHAVPPPADEPAARPTNGATDWATHAQAAAESAGAAQGAATEPPPEPAVRLADIPWMQGAFITASKFLVAAQLRAQAIAARWIADVDLGPVGPPPPPQPKTMEEFQALLESMAQPWSAFDPREPGRQIWEGFLRRICPDDLPLPDWVQAPLLVALFTLPVQLMGMQKAKPEPEQQEAAAAQEQATAAAA